MPPRRRRSTRRRLAAPLVLLASLAAGGCSDDPEPAPGAADVAVRPFAEVQASDFTFAADPGDPTRGTFHVTTTEPMICAIVWGETDAFGRLNNSSAMDGTGIIEHDVGLPDIEPGRRYVFVVQGTTADGTLYRSPTGTFTIPAGAPPAPTTGDGATDLARTAHVVDVSSEYSDAFAATNAIDGSGSTEWATAGDGDDAFIVLDLGHAAAIGDIEVLTRSMSDGSAIIDTYTVTVDGGAPLGPFPAGTAADPVPAPVDVTGQVVRIDVDRSSGGNVGAVAIRILGA